MTQAKTFCVNVTSTAGCDKVEAAGGFQTALDDAKANPGADTVRLGATPATIANAGGFHYADTDPVAIQGTGGRDFGQLGPTLEDSTASPSDETVLNVISASPSTISGIDVVVPNGPTNIGIDSNATMSNVAVEPASAPSGSPLGVLLESGGALTGSDVSLPTNLPSSVGILSVGVGALVDGSRVQAARAIQTATGAAGPLSGTVRRSEIVSSIKGIEVDAGDFLVEDTLLRNVTDNVSSHNGVSASAMSKDTTLSLDHVTMVGAAAGGIALTATANSSHTAAISFRNSVFSGYGATFARTASAGSTASISTDYSDYSGTPSTDSGAGAITETNHLTAAPGFLSATDFHLRPDSPLVDAGDPAALAAGESETDLAGQPRIVDGNGDCAARRDVGAYEFAPGPRAPNAAATAAPATALVGQAVTFDASGSCDPDGEALTYSWAFDEGPVASGATRTRAFSSPGKHFGTVTVTDSTGRSSTATATVVVVPEVLPPFAGVTIKRQTVRVSRRRVAAVKLSCPASTVGACAGTLTLTRAGGRKLGSASFSVGRGLTRRVNVTLTSSAFKALGKARRENTTAAATAHDTNGTSKRRTATVRLVAPPR